MISRFLTLATERGWKPYAFKLTLTTENKPVRFEVAFKHSGLITKDFQRTHDAVCGLRQTGVEKKMLRGVVIAVNPKTDLSSTRKTPAWMHAVFYAPDAQSLKAIVQSMKRRYPEVSGRAYPVNDSKIRDLILRVRGRPMRTLARINCF